MFLADPAAPISAVAARAGVGISALYLRYASKDGLLRELARDGLARYIADLETALADHGDPWTVYVVCLMRIVDGRSQALAQRLAGTFTPTPDLGELAARAGQLAEQLHRRATRQKVLRSDVTSADIVLLLETIMLVEAPGADGGAALRRRYLTLLTQALRAPSAGPLPGPAAQAGDLARRWHAKP